MTAHVLALGTASFTVNTVTGAGKALFIVRIAHVPMVIVPKVAPTLSAGARRSDPALQKIRHDGQ